MQTIYYKDSKASKIQTHKKIRKGGWIRIESPTISEIMELCSKLGLDETIALDALDSQEIPRIEREDGIHYIFTRVAHTQTGLSSTTPLLIIITKESIVTISKEKLSLIENFANKEQFNTTKKTKFIIQLFLFINAHYQENFKKISKDIRNATKDIEKIKNKDVTQLVRFEAMFNDFLAALEPGNIILEKLLSGKYLPLFEEDRDLVEDLFIANNQLIDECQIHLKHIVNVRDAYTTIITNNLNKTIKILTSITVILTIPTIIASIFGMNVNLPLQTHPFAFGYIIIFIIGALFALSFVFAKKDMF